MKLVSTIAIAASLLAGATIAAAPAAAQKKGKPAAAAAGQSAERKFNMSKQAQKPLSDLQAAVTAKNNASVPALIAAAEAVATTTDDKYLVAKFRLQHAINMNDKAGQLAAIESVLASGGADATETANLNRFVGGLAIESNDYAKAEQSLAQQVAADPNNLDAVVNLARAKLELKKEAEGLDLLQRAITLSKAAGQQPPEAWYRNSLAIAHKQKKMPLANQMARALLENYPSKENLRNAVALYLPTASQNKDTYIDLLRLMYVSETMASGPEYLELAALLDEARFPGESKAVLDAATRTGKLTGGSGAQLLSRANARVAEDRAALAGVEPKARAAANGVLALSTATAYYGYRDYAKAVEFYRLALQKGGVNADVVNTRMGIALAMAGNKAEAETAFRAVKGNNAELASLWLAWLKQRA